MAAVVIRKPRNNAILSAHTETVGSSKQRLFRRALILTKSTRWEFEQKRNPRLSRYALLTLLKRRGTDVAEMLRKHQQQQHAVTTIRTKLVAQGIENEVADRHTLSQQSLQDVDLVVSAGGDGTFLTAAAAVADSTPVIGVNTDPVGSEGHLCIGGKCPPTDLIERLASGRFKWSHRQRLRVTFLKGFESSSLSEGEKILALNDIFIGENNSAKVSYYEVAIDDEPAVKQKSSGVIVCTGTGSTSWNLSTNRVQEETMTNVLAVLKSMGVLGVDGEATSAIAREACERVNASLVFEPDQPNLAFTIREPIFNATFPRTRSRGFARRLLLKSRCSDASIVVDGSRFFSFNHGAEILIEIHEEDALRTISLD